MLMSVALEDYFYAKSPVLSVSANTWYRQKLGLFEAWCRERGVVDLDDITRPLLRQYVRHVKETKPLLAPRTLHGYVRVLKAFFNWCAAEGYSSRSLMTRFEMPKLDTKVIAVFTPKHIAALFAACDVRAESPQQAARDKAILAVLLDTGVRANELCTLTLDVVHITRDDAFLIVTGKGNKQREVGLGLKARHLLSRYLHGFRGAYSPRESERTVFLAKGATPLRPEGLHRLLDSLRDRADITDIPVNPHRFRHTFAVNFMEQNNDVLRLSRILGHTSLAVTDNYLKAFTSRSARQGKSVLDNL